MITNNCVECMYSENTECTLYITGLVHNETEYCKCNHENSPHYGELVNDYTTCRLFEDYNKHILKKDRKEKINNLKNK